MTSACRAAFCCVKSGGFGLCACCGCGGGAGWHFGGPGPRPGSWQPWQPWHGIGGAGMGVGPGPICGVGCMGMVGGNGGQEAMGTELAGNGGNGLLDGPQGPGIGGIGPAPLLAQFLGTTAR